eukprot:GHVR01015254.1.p1 GENE.GHVR01015254.1~~GHVR01015254.1.p1  ORF type:complete len:123 (-),score=21.01 GHVR01015254.1:138-506(-)
MPAFFCPDSGVPVPITVESELLAASILHQQITMQIQSGIVFAAPIPSTLAADCTEIEEATTQAIREAEEKGISGRDITPFILSRIAELTCGRSLESNISLALHNASVGANIAVHLYKLLETE